MAHLHPDKDKHSLTEAGADSSNIFLVGYMASGKTTFGKALAEKTGLQFIDLDLFIESKYNKTITEIFESIGENGFRQIEKEALKEVAVKKGIIIACGGGTPCFFDNMDFINDNGISVFLEATVPVLIKRLIEENSHRPIVKDKTPEEIKSLIATQLERRLPFYKKAKLVWNTDKLDSEEEISDNIERFILENSFVFSKSFN